MPESGKRLAAVRGTTASETQRRLTSAERRRLRRQIEASYRNLFLCWVGRLRRKYGLSRDDARDVVQDAFLLAMAKLPRIENMRVWLEGVISRLALDLLRKRDRRAELLARWAPTAARPTEEEENSDEL